MNEETAYLALGANLGDKTESLRAAVRMLNRPEMCSVVQVSSLYLTRPVGVEDQPDFLNAVMQVRTSLSPRDLLVFCMDVEKSLGKRRTIRWGPRVIDIDILVYGNANVKERDLTIPHPRMMERAFVLVPLAEIAPDYALADGSTVCEAAQRLGCEGVERIHR